jgi:hypothetical protein
VTRGFLSEACEPLLDRALTHESVDKNRHSALLERRHGEESPRRSPQRISLRLGANVIEQILADYRSGLPSTILGRRYGIASGTVVALLRQHGVVVRQQPMTPAECREASRLYSLGWPLAKIGSKLGRPPNSIRNALSQAGIPRRSPNFRPEVS